MKITEADIRVMVTESVNKILTEGLANTKLKLMARKHGGIKYNPGTISALDKWVGKGVTLYELPNVYELEKTKDTKVKTLANQVRDMEYKFLKRVVMFNDGFEAFMLNPKYQDNPSVTAEIEKLEQETQNLKSARTQEFADGKQFYNNTGKWFRNREGDMEYREYDEPDYDSPRDATDNDRMKVHRAARGKSVTGQGKGNTSDYNKYVQRYAQQIANEYGMERHKWDDAYIGYLTPSEESEMLSKFKKIGWDKDDAYSEIRRWDDEGKRKVGVCPRGRTYIEWDDPAFGPDGYVRGPKSPKIGYNK